MSDIIDRIAALKDQTTDQILDDLSAIGSPDMSFAQGYWCASVYLIDDKYNGGHQFELTTGAIHASSKGAVIALAIMVISLVADD